jgi:hypothetical protein
MKKIKEIQGNSVEGEGIPQIESNRAGMKKRDVEYFRIEPHKVVSSLPTEHIV